MEQQTGKRVKYVGTQKYINADTGEIEEMQVTSIEDRDFNFAKVWMKNLIMTMNIVGDKKTRFCFWLIDQINKENQIIGTQRVLANKSGISLQTVNITLKLLLDADFLRKVQTGVYMINPNIVFKGSRTSRLNMLNQYSRAEHIKMDDTEKLQNILKSIAELTRQADILQKKISANENN